MPEQNELERIALGSGTLYCMEFAGSGTALPEDAVIETEANILGRIQGGASVEYGQTLYTAEDDLGLAKRTVLTKEEVKMKSGIMTWNAYVLEKLTSTGRITEDAAKKTRTIKIGGVGNTNGKRYLLRFVNNDPIYGKTRLTIAGTNQAGLTLAFAKDKETVINAEFLAEPLDGEGTLVIYEESAPELTEPAPANLSK